MIRSPFWLVEGLVGFGKLILGAKLLEKVVGLAQSTLVGPPESTSWSLPQSPVAESEGHAELYFLSRKALGYKKQESELSPALLNMTQDC